MTRLRAKYGAAEARAILSREAAETEKAADANSTPLGRENDDQKKRAASFFPALPAAGAAEWWDAALLSGGKSYGAEVLREKITLYVEHPVPLPPPAGAEAPPPPPQPLKLTKAEQKKLRTQRRVAREQEKQEMIRQGLLEPPKPKVKISNLMRVLTDTAAADPTAIEKEVRAQMAERAEAHEDRNLARALTPAERKEKKLRKMFEDSGGSGETHVRVYRIESLKNPKHKFRVDINAQENHLTGTRRACAFFSCRVSLSVSRRREKKRIRRSFCSFSVFHPVARRLETPPTRNASRPLKTPRSLCTESLRALSGDRAKSQHEAGTESRLFARNLLTPLVADELFVANAVSLCHFLFCVPTGVCVVIEDGFCVVVVEGVAKAIRRYEKLMTRRIDWSSTGLEDDDVGDERTDDGSGGKRNACVCVWSGTTASPAFEGAFRFETFRSLVSARARFKDVGLAHFFDAAEGSVAAADEAAEAED